MNSELHHVVRQPKKQVEQPPLLILLHGYGSNELDLFSFADELPDELLIVSARAPYNIPYGGHSWYAINLDGNNEKFSDLDEARTSLIKIATFVDRIKEHYNSASNNTFLLGFSQGAILSYAFSFLYPNKVQHVLALSGYINDELLPIAISKLAIETDYFISHGSADQVLPVDWARKAPVFLTTHNLQHTYTEYPIGHGISPQNFYALNLWIEARLQG
ncbi:MAG: alpha/beta hydrolase-fold protein [Polaribacter sp.]|nr:alpha/beta hydrolase-fold protein [Polaribacter sp.]